MSGRWGIRPRLLLGCLGALAPVLVVVPFLVGESRVLGERLRGVAERELARLELADAAAEAIVAVGNPVRDHFVAGGAAPREEFHREVVRARGALLGLQLATAGDAPAHALATRALEALGRAEARGAEIVAAAEPRAAPGALERLRGFEALGVEALGHVHELARRERGRAAAAVAGARGLLQRGRAASTAATEASVLGGVALAVIFAQWMSGPLLAIGRGSRRLAEGDLGHRLDVRAGGELGEAAAAFNAMAEHLQVSTRALRDSEARYRLLAENASDVIIVLDLALQPTYVSPSIKEVIGEAPEEVQARPLGARLTPASRERIEGVLAEELARERAGGADPARSRATELEVCRKDGSTVWVEMRSRFLRDAAGQPVAIIGVSRDISERKRLDELKADFVTLTTHQLRTPLGGMRWLLELAAEAPELGEATRSYIQGARDSAERLAGIVNNLLDATQLESASLRLDPAPVDLGEMTRSVLEEMGPVLAARPLRISVTGGEGIGPLSLDGRWLRQAVLNLVSNAVKYTPAGGEVAIRMSREADGVRWEVRDSGIGIPREAQARLFEKFYRAPNASTIAPEGTGLGLYLTRLIVERMGGRVSFQSEAGRGALFALTLPAGRPAGS